MSKPKIDKEINIPLEILAQLLTPSEARMLKNRWQIINLLEDGLSIRAIALEVKVGTDTVVRVARMIERKNLRAVIDQMKEKDRDSSSTSWVFGKGDK
jgi:uncharacterized protein YerC